MYCKSNFAHSIDTHALTGVVLKSKFKLRLPPPSFFGRKSRSGRSRRHCYFIGFCLKFMSILSLRPCLRKRFVVSQGRTFLGERSLFSLGRISLPIHQQAGDYPSLRFFGGQWREDATYSPALIIDTHALTGVVLKSKFKLRLPSIFLALHLYVFLYDAFLDTYRGHEVAL